MKSLPPYKPIKFEVECEVSEILLNPAHALQIVPRCYSNLEDREQIAFLKLVFLGDNGNFIMVFDQRWSSVRAYIEGNIDKLADEFMSTDLPCYGRMARNKRGGLYIELEDFLSVYDRVDENDRRYNLAVERLIKDVVLAVRPIDHEKHRVIISDNREALHPATGICLCRRRIPKC